MEETRLRSSLPSSTIPLPIPFRFSNHFESAGCSLMIFVQSPQQTRKIKLHPFLRALRYHSIPSTDGNRLFAGRMSHYVGQDSSYRTANDAKNRVQS